MKYFILALPLFLFFAACSNKNTEEKTKTETENTEMQEKERIEEIDPMYLVPNAEKHEDGTVTFSVESYRNWTPPYEYIPDSEHFRVEIFTKKGNLVWSSSHGKNFSQVIGKVQPEIAGEKHVYEQEWNGMDNAGYPVPSGEYKVKMTIPAKPIEHTASMTFYWGGSDENER